MAAIAIVGALATAVAGGVVLLVRQHLKWRAGCRAGAAKIYGEVAEIYRDQHAYRVAAEGEFPKLDVSGYRAVREALLARGFRHLATLENLTVSRVHPEHRTFTDSYAAADGIVGVATYRVADRQTVEIGSVLEDGRFLVTTNAELDTLTPPPAVLKCTLAFDTPLETLLARHQERLDALRTAEPSATFFAVRTLDDVLAVSQRHSRLVCEHRRGLGFLTEQEMLGWATRLDQEATARRIWKEFVRIREEKRGA